MVLATTYVGGFVHFGTLIPEISHETIEALKREFPADEMLVIEQQISEGEEVEIAEGPFRGSVATVTRLLPSRDRVAVLLNFLGSTREVEVPLLALLGLRDIRQVALSEDK